MTVRADVKRRWYAVPLAWGLALGLGVCLQACGGGGGGGGAAASTDPSGTAAAAGQDVTATEVARLRSLTGVSSALTTATSSTWTQVGPISEQDAARFLTQATFGPTSADVANVKSLGYTGWLNAQFTKPREADSHLQFYDARDAEWRARGGRAAPADVMNSFWKSAVTGNDQLRQRVTFALSEIFVVSLADTCGDLNNRGVADFLDVLHRQAFGTFRQLIESVALHPIMGCYLSHVHNQKEDAASGRNPDENFAREIMQLFSIGLRQLNEDGTPVLSNGQPVPTYGPKDVIGMARVFTGFSWECPLPDADAGCFERGSSYNGMKSDPDLWVKPMRAYPRFHSTSEKAFLGKTLGAQTTPDPDASLRFALDTLAQHDNVGPFLGKQLIQKLVTSNPSPAYVARVARAFKASNGSLRALVTAVLTDTEARDTAAALASNRSGKVREPVLRLTAALRALEGRSVSGRFLIGDTSDPVIGLGQAPMYSPSVFNFFRPGYTPPGSFSAAAGLVVPEMQLANETSVAANLAYFGKLLSHGLGPQATNGQNQPDVDLAFLRVPNSGLLALAATPTGLVEHINQKLLYGTMSTSLRNDLLAVVTPINEPPARVQLALLITLASPEFLVQR